MECGDYGGRTDKGDPCTRPSGWGRDAATGRCQLHHDPAEDARRRDGDQADTRDDVPEPPTHLSEQAARVWRDVHSRWVLNEAEKVTLQSGLEALDLYREAMSDVRRRGLTVETSGGVEKRNPSVLTARDAIRDYRSTMKELPIALGDLEQ